MICGNVTLIFVPVQDFTEFDILNFTPFPISDTIDVILRFHLSLKKVGEEVSEACSPFFFPKSIYVSLNTLRHTDRGSALSQKPSCFSDGPDAQEEDCILTAYSKVTAHYLRHCNKMQNETMSKRFVVNVLNVFLSTQWDQIQELLGHPVEKPVVLHR